MESASIPNHTNTLLLLSRTIQALEELADEDGFYVDWAVDGSLHMDDIARSYAILEAEDLPYVYYSLQAEREAQCGGFLTLYYGCERQGIDDVELAELGRSVKAKLHSKCLNVAWDGNPCSGMAISHSKASLRDLSSDSCMMVSLYLDVSSIGDHPEVYKRYYPNECLEENGDPADCVNIYLKLAEGESVRNAILRLLPEISTSDIRYYRRCFDDGAIIQPVEAIVEWDDSEL